MEQDTDSHIALGWESDIASRQGSGLVCISLVNLLSMAMRQTEMVLKAFTHYFTETFLNDDVFQMINKNNILIMSRP